MEHLSDVNERDLRTLVVELEHEGLIVVETATVKENPSDSFIGGDYEKDDKELN